MDGRIRRTRPDRMPLVSDINGRIVLVDDDAALREALRFSLEIEGYQVDTCETGEELVAHDLPGTDACLVVDYKLGGISGLDALETLRARGVALPAILITSNPTPSTRARAQRNRAIIVEKPLLGDLLVAKIRDALAA